MSRKATQTRNVPPSNVHRRLAKAWGSQGLPNSDARNSQAFPGTPVASGAGVGQAHAQARKSDVLGAEVPNAEVPPYSTAEPARSYSVGRAHAGLSRSPERLRARGGGGRAARSEPRSRRSCGMRGSGRERRPVWKSPWSPGRTAPADSVPKLAGSRSAPAPRERGHGRPGPGNCARRPRALTVVCSWLPGARSRPPGPQKLRTTPPGAYGRLLLAPGLGGSRYAVPPALAPLVPRLPIRASPANPTLTPPRLGLPEGRARAGPRAAGRPGFSRAPPLLPERPGRISAPA
ncbi:serine/arginine repetitive matrix protein 3-like [Phocoena phocoena]|uniref:serine/arginine repetitive matrix protein 3-like n=1 Tax=Phocoena phocoena TaxID=9742 RepID=UPI0033074D9F